MMIIWTALAKRSDDFWKQTSDELYAIHKVNSTLWTLILFQIIFDWENAYTKLMEKLISFNDVFNQTLDKVTVFTGNCRV